ncbi:MAG TPA: CehA/McbA family metallohydrolase [Planctomycetota bacterium]|jgi:hypothetical protein|nr:hypothetical protein [Planctomycetota bacterium]MDP7245327.1 CehA/McbA family metallohydrolase [Planctomycetota bacterium]HJM39929.1 CehA/McbA family metallohydrolase [Planctomycetota bacterium]|tara:strand:- start:528 stop:2378 length:1851 start_codon:yes stop_codon:yes gene_type:complete
MFSVLLLAQAAVAQNPGSRPEILEAMRADIAAERHESDGGGRAWLEESQSDMEVVAGGVGNWKLIYEAGEHGIPEGGMLFFQLSPFWGWSTPRFAQEAATRPGSTQITVHSEGVGWEAETIDQQLMVIRFTKGGLKKSDRVVLNYTGLADRYSEQSQAFWFSVDGDGDGIRALVRDTKLEVKVLPRDAVGMHLVLPTAAEPGDTVRMHVSYLDATGNLALGSFGDIFFDLPTGIEFSGPISLHAGSGGVDLVVSQEGVYTVKGVGPAGEATSNPMVVRKGVENILWADLQVHTALSDGTGSLDEVYHYARNVAGLDAVCITDHDHWGMKFLDQNPEMWESVKTASEKWNEPGRFVAFLGYEWTNWVSGHRHVLFPGTEGVPWSSADEKWDTPQELWEEVKKVGGITIAHHSAGGPVPTDWRIPPDPDCEPITEIVSVHGSSESADTPGRIYSAIKGNYVRDALGRGYQLGFIGSTDGHDGHPGLSQLAGASGGLAAIITKDKTRKGILKALRERRCYATNGPRIGLRFQLGDASMGGFVQKGDEELKLICRVIGTDAIDYVDIIHNEKLAQRVDGKGKSLFFFDLQVPAMNAGDFVYLRVLQKDGGAAWSSPIFCK